MDVFLDEADPTHWPGRGLKLGAMDAQTRGDLYWVRKTAASAAMLHGRVEAMIGRVQLAGAGTTPQPDAEGETKPADDMEAEIRQFERQAAKMIDEAQRNSKKAAFDTKTHGKR